MSSPSPLRTLRLLRGLRLRDVEHWTGIPDTTVSRLERGELPLVGRWLTNLAQFYKTPPQDLNREMKRWGLEATDERVWPTGDNR
jgi:hypothetical protein